MPPGLLNAFVSSLGNGITIEVGAGKITFKSIQQKCLDLDKWGITVAQVGITLNHGMMGQASPSLIAEAYRVLNAILNPSS